MEKRTCPPGLEEKLREHDRNLRVVWNAYRGLWEIKQFLPNSGELSHVTYWADGGWPNLRYKQLPLSVDPILEKLGMMDLARMGMDLSQYSTYLDGLASAGASKRAAVQREQLSRKMSEYYAWTRRRMSTVLRRAQYGGRSAKAAMAEYARAKEDLGLSSG